MRSKGNVTMSFTVPLIGIIASVGTVIKEVVLVTNASHLPEVDKLAPLNLLPASPTTILKLLPLVSTIKSSLSCERSGFSVSSTSPDRIICFPFGV